MVKLHYCYSLTIQHFNKKTIQQQRNLVIWTLIKVNLEKLAYLLLFFS